MRFVRVYIVLSFNLLDWLEAASEDDVRRGKQEAYCNICEVFLRAHHTDLVKHATECQRHLKRAKDFDRNVQRTVDDHGMTCLCEMFSICVRDINTGLY